MVLTGPAPIGSAPLCLTELPLPEPGPGEVQVAVEVCGVCRTDLHVVEGDLPVRRPGIIPGHEVVGRVTRLGEGATRFAIGDRVGSAWLHASCGRCEYCRQPCAAVSAGRRARPLRRLLTGPPPALRRRCP